MCRASRFSPHSHQITISFVRIIKAPGLRESPAGPSAHDRAAAPMEPSGGRGASRFPGQVLVGCLWVPGVRPPLLSLPFPRCRPQEEPELEAAGGAADHGPPGPGRGTREVAWFCLPPQPRTRSRREACDG